MIRRPDAIKFLATRGWLSLTSPEFRTSVFDRLHLREYKKGDTIYRAGDPPGGLWAVVSGGAQLESEAHLTNFINPGIWFDEGPLVFGSNRRIGVIAVRPSMMATLPLPDCHAILRADPGAWRWVAVLASMLNVSAIERFNEHMLHDPAKRAAAALLRLSGVTRAPLWRMDPSPIYLSQQKIADLLNISRTSAVAILSDFERRRLIELQYGSIVVTDADGLREVVAREDEHPDDRGFAAPRAGRQVGVRPIRPQR